MCGACGTPTALWTERISPLGPGAAWRRARALNTALELAGTAPHRVRVVPWHGGGLSPRTPAGWHYERSLTPAARWLSARFGPLVPAAGDDPSTCARLPEDREPDGLAVWCALVAASGHGPVVLTLPGLRVQFAGEVLVESRCGTEPRDSVLRAPAGARRLLGHLRALAPPCRRPD
ncbi:hypothetical protein FHS29_003825 [Saccharothrix tamanrassetensis]|uniref:Uncharacterized protein n=1 Tax=Saccharothrix tamanrassetensis TaxID=1051531 RepID=A0A841CFA8_9PSEU|nr:hypothetical protein [Saccharothrix tamanrassetensis]MBB5957232.1 hypothetical protein [Saccharothrix tamanrassetensis]